ncbi:MAG: pyruvate dehydrogenase (acetyl-transferring) E1 component subunit alpha [Comamonadaceae bacterium]|nr:MAG: pyruvate dehydrogenase (acetyl-transferring) E1 component subunit alpha [Comamonadaceae bacterium]
MCRDLYRQMRLARRLDEEALALQRQGELGLWLQSLGQEAAQVGSITAIQPTDYVFPTYREHAAALTRGITPPELLVQWRGNQHSGWDPDQYRFHIYTLVLAAQLPHATGYAMGVQRDGANEMVLAYIGDGATSEGDASEALNWAASADVPLLFFCQNNHWAISTPTRTQMRAPLYQRARGFGLEAHQVDGNDVLAVRAVTSAVADRIRAGGGPAFIEAITYRMAGHSTSDDPGRYRSDSELDSWRSRDPIARLRALLDKQRWADDTFHTELEDECDDLAARTRSACLNLPLRDFDTLFDNVLAEATPRLLEQRNSYRELVDSFID